MNTQKTYFHRVNILLAGVTLALILQACGWGQSLVYRHLTDEFYLLATDEIEQLSVSYHDSGESYAGVIDATVFAVGCNADFIIAKGHAWNAAEPKRGSDTLYYIIDVRQVKKERTAFKSSPMSYNNVYKDIHGLDSLGPEISFMTTYTPEQAKAMTLEEFEAERKRLKIPPGLKFDIVYDEVK